jgi:hypothetical protein
MERKYPPIPTDDDRPMFCPSCKTTHPTVPLEGVPNQSLRACSFCGGDFWDDLNHAVPTTILEEGDTE